MTKVERHLDILSTLPSVEYFLNRTAQGWTLAGIEWKREVSGNVPPKKESSLPFGTQVAEDRNRLVGNPREQEILRLMMKLIVNEVSFSRIADELNRQGHRTREGKRWGQTSVYCMLPRLIEVGPEIFKAADWPQHRETAL